MGQSGKYFNALTTGTVTKVSKSVIRPTITAGRQDSAVFADASILWNWFAVEVPKGSSKLISVTAIVRGTDGAAQGALPIDLIFGKSIDQVAPPNLGVVGAAVTTFNWANNVIGYHTIVAGDYTDADLVVLRVAQSGITTGSKELVLTGEPASGQNVGYDTIYIAGLAKAEFDFRSTVVVSTGRDADDVSDGTALDGVVKTKSALVNFSNGDVIHDEDNLVVGEVKSIESATALTYVPGSQEDIQTVDKKLYNIHPIQLILGFEA